MDSTPHSLSASELDAPTLALAKVLLKRQAAQERFERQHGEGSVERLVAMGQAGKTLVQMGEVFGLTDARMGQIWRDITGDTYQNFLKSHGLPTRIRPQ